MKTIKYIKTSLSLCLKLFRLYKTKTKNEKSDQWPMFYDIKIDWSRIPVDTPVLVKDWPDDEWQLRYFAEYLNGMVLTWGRGLSSNTTNGMMEVWTWAILA